MITRTDALTDALERLTGYEYLDGVGFACHGPMGAEALSALGYDDLIANWVETYKAKHPPIEAPPVGARLNATDETSWRPALGDLQRVSDWAAMFTGELQDQPWESVLRQWLPRLLPGAAGGLTHGLLRTAHGARALQAVDSPPQPLLDELAKGLALWAGFFKTLPGRPDLSGTATLTAAIAGLPRPDDPWTPIEAGGMTRFGELTGFADAVQALGAPADADEALSDLTSAFCRVFLVAPDVISMPLVHLVTPTAAVRALMPYLPELSAEAVYAQFWQISAAITCGFTPHQISEQQLVSSRGDLEPPPPSELGARAAEHQDPHVVKFTEACLREHALRPDAVYLHAAQKVLTTMPAL